MSTLLLSEQLTMPCLILSVYFAAARIMLGSLMSVCMNVCVTMCMSVCDYVYESVCDGV